MSDYHVPVLGEEALDFLLEKGEGLFLDGTVGGGGHTLMLLERCPDCRVLAVDRDPDALEEARGRLAEHRDRVRFLATRFDRATDDIEVRDCGLDGALLDLGVSSHQLDEDSRGFTFRRGAPLDMRMTPDGPTAADILARASVEELGRIFHEYGEERHARRLARAIVEARSEMSIETSDQLVGLVDRSLPGRVDMQDRARIFQALRIEVNDEMDALEAALPAIRDALNHEGVMVVIAYHSLEDRIVKNAFREWSRSCVCPPGMPICTCRGEPLGETLTRKPVRPAEAEVEANPRARSARLRAWRKAA
ncbi:MAG TPA: 16S rRNA (cytosine(1402)-N(4))-methyltransferase RsmH [Longimicrobiales bacterium]|nr:16S rRNA (cytosine(1402)-N(4))-methyltransferase RsmH [Longimicrobiales bacterium]